MKIICMGYKVSQEEIAFYIDKETKAPTMRKLLGEIAKCHDDEEAFTQLDESLHKELAKYRKDDDE